MSLFDLLNIGLKLYDDLQHTNEDRPAIGGMLVMGIVDKDSTGLKANGTLATAWLERGESFVVGGRTYAVHDGKIGELLRTWKSKRIRYIESPDSTARANLTLDFADASEVVLPFKPDGGYIFPHTFTRAKGFRIAENSEEINQYVYAEWSALRIKENELESAALEMMRKAVGPNIL